MESSKSKESSEPNASAQKELNIQQEFKNALWIEHFGKESFGTCSCCQFTMISQDNFNCMYPLTKKKKNICGAQNIQNMIPVCDSCYASNIYKTIAKKQHKRGSLSSLGLINNESNTLTNNEITLKGDYYKEQKDYENMKIYYDLAIEKNDNVAMYKLGLYYEEQKDFNNMRKYYLMAIENNNYDAAYHMGIFYKEKHDFASMKKFLLMATNGKHPKASEELGYFYYYHKNYTLAKKYFISSLEMCNDGALYGLALCHKDQDDNENMLKYFNMAADKGISEAKYELGKYYEALKDYDKMKLFYKSIVNTNEHAAYRLGRYYQKRAHFNRMKTFYLRAIENGNDAALRKLNKYYAKENIKVKIIFEKEPEPSFEQTISQILGQEQNLETPQKIIPLQKLFM